MAWNSGKYNTSRFPLFFSFLKKVAKSIMLENCLIIAKGL